MPTMRYGAALIAVAASACIEGKDPNDCSGNGACPDSRVCSRAYRCEMPEDLVDITTHWTFAGVAPTPTAPSRCADFGGFMVGASGPNEGFGDAFACELGSAELKRVPKTMTMVQATAYGGNGHAIVGSAQVDRAGATEVTLDFVP